VGLTKTITVTLSASDLNDIIFKSNGIGYLNLYLQDDTGVDSVELAYVN
jgi:hypothetical protein